MKMRDLYTVALKNGDLFTGTTEEIERIKDQTRGRARPVISLSREPVSGVYFVDFNVKSCGRTLYATDDRASAERFYQTAQSLDETDFQEIYCK